MKICLTVNEHQQVAVSFGRPTPVRCVNVSKLRTLQKSFKETYKGFGSWYYTLVCGRVPDLQSGGCGFESQPGLLRTKVYSAFHPFGVGNWVPAAVGKAKAGMAHSDCGWTRGCAVKTVKSLENTCHTWALLWWFTTKRRYIKCVHFVALPLPFVSHPISTTTWVSQYQNIKPFKFCCSKRQ